VKQLEEHVRHFLKWRNQWDAWAQSHGQYTHGYAAWLCRQAHYRFSSDVSTTKGWALEVEEVDLHLVAVVENRPKPYAVIVETGYSTTSYDGGFSSATVIAKASQRVNFWQRSGSSPLPAEYDRMLSSFGTQTHRLKHVNKPFVMAGPVYVYIGMLRIVTKDGGVYECWTDEYAVESTPRSPLRFSVPDVV